MNSMPQNLMAQPNISAMKGSKKAMLKPQPTVKPLISLGIGVDGLISKALRFLSTASNEMLCCIAVGLAAGICVILGRFGLLLVGVFIGIILHATWEGWNATSGGLEDAQKDKGLDVIKRILDWREKNVISLDTLDVAENFKLAAGVFGDFKPETKMALNAFVDAVILDYVKSWYGPIVPLDESFPTACRQTLTSFLWSASVHLSKKRPADTFLHFLTNSSSIIIVFLDEISNALSTFRSLKGTLAESVDEYLLANPDSHLANIISVTEQKRKFEVVAEDVLGNFLDRPTYQCNLTRIFLKEVLAGVLLEMSLTICSKPEWINGWIVSLLEEGEPEVIQAIDAGMASRSSDYSDSNVGDTSSVKGGQIEDGKHRKRLSKAEEVMEEAMEEAKRLSQLIAEDDQRRADRTEIQDISNRSVRTTNPGDRNRDKLLNPQRSELVQQALNYNKSEAEVQEKVVKSQPPHHTGGDGTWNSFTNFDQILLPARQTALQVESHGSIISSSSALHNANIIIDDDSTTNDKGRIRTKPMGEYLIQIEPNALPGWLTVRRFQDFENLHEILRRIANISGVVAFTEQHSTLPDWRIHTKVSLRIELERYLRDACWHQLLAESEGMKRFLEKDQGSMPTPINKGVGWPTPAAFETMGKGMLDVLASAPKGATEGSRAMLDGVTGVLGNIGSLGQKKKESTTNLGVYNLASTSDNAKSINGTRRGMYNEESQESSPLVQSQPGPVSPLGRTLSYASGINSGTENGSIVKGQVSISTRLSTGDQTSRSNSRDPTQAPPIAVTSSPSSPNYVLDVESIALPPLPTDITDDYGSKTPRSSLSHSRADSITPTARTSISATSSPMQTPGRGLISVSGRPPLLPRPQPGEPAPLTEQETRVAIELLFAMINELYTLSSAWNIRRTLLNAAKTFLLRPGNPFLASIQSLIQDSFITTSTSDASIATLLRKLRENTIPTEEEMKNWPAELTADEKEKLQIKARKLLVERGMPEALISVMGQGATREAMGKVFDCLQIRNVARGLMFGLLLQGVRAMTD